MTSDPRHGKSGWVYARMVSQAGCTPRLGQIFQVNRPGRRLITREKGNTGLVQ